jgi:hypothetical protein
MRLTLKKWRSLHLMKFVLSPSDKHHPTEPDCVSSLFILVIFDCSHNILSPRGHGCAGHSLRSTHAWHKKQTSHNYLWLPTTCPTALWSLFPEHISHEKMLCSLSSHTRCTHHGLSSWSCRHYMSTKNWPVAPLPQFQKCPAYFPRCQPRSFALFLWTKLCWSC